MQNTFLNFDKKCFIINSLEYFNEVSFFNKKITNKLKYVRGSMGLNKDKKMDYIILLELNNKKDFNTNDLIYIKNKFIKLYKNNFDVDLIPCNYNDMLVNKTYYVIIRNIFKNDFYNIDNELNFYKKNNKKNCYNNVIYELLKYKNQGHDTIQKDILNKITNKYIR